jgi:hypothetical protein
VCVCLIVCGLVVGDLEARKHGDLDLIWPDVHRKRMTFGGRKVEGQMRIFPCAPLGMRAVKCRFTLPYIHR